MATGEASNSYLANLVSPPRLPAMCVRNRPQKSWVPGARSPRFLILHPCQQTLTAAAKCHPRRGASIPGVQRRSASSARSPLTVDEGQRLASACRCSVGPSVLARNCDELYPFGLSRDADSCLHRSCCDGRDILPPQLVLLDAWQRSSQLQHRISGKRLCNITQLEHIFARSYANAKP